MNAIRDLFAGHRKIDRRIEKVIDYYADDEERLAAEIAEYEVTTNIEENFQKFLELYRDGVQANQVTEIGIWVSGFYGSGKSSFTKYLGFALDPNRAVHGQPFFQLLQARLNTAPVRALLGNVARNLPTAVVMLDLGAEQLATSATETVSRVLYWKVLQKVGGYSKEKKLAQLEFRLDELGRYADFQTAFRERFNTEWTAIHNDPMIGVMRASQLLPDFLPNEFPDATGFARLHFDMADTVRDLAQCMIDLTRRKTGCHNIIFLIDEAGQYVAPRGELILNLDGLARSLKELGQGGVWLVATGQQTLSEISDRAAYNSTELNKLRARFPVSIELDARDIREITYRRLLTKSDEGEASLRSLYRQHGQSMLTHTRLNDSSLFRHDPSADEFVRTYPFLPQHFNLLMELIRKLASRTGGIGLRSAIKVIQDVLVDSSRILPADALKLADRPTGALACVDDFYSTLRHDFNKQYPHVVAGVDSVEQHYAPDSLHVRVARAVAALQPLENFPSTAEHIAALLYRRLSDPSLLDDVRRALTDLIGAPTIGLIDDPQTGGFQFLSANVAPLQQKRRAYIPGSGELTRARNRLLIKLFDPQPKARLHETRDISALVRAGRNVLVGRNEDIGLQLEQIEPERWDEVRESWLRDTAQQREHANTIVWLYRSDGVAEDTLIEVCKSEYIVGEIDERIADSDVAQYTRAERRLAELNRERAQSQFRAALQAGTFIWRGRPLPVGQLGDALATATREVLTQAAADLFSQYRLVPIRPNTNLAAQFLRVERLDRISSDRDPLHLVQRQGSSPRIDPNHQALTETLREFRRQTSDGGTRVTGRDVQDRFAQPPWGWSKDATRYLFAALLVAGEIEVHSNGEVLRTAGPISIEAFENTLSFNRVTLGLRNSRPNLATLERAAQRLEDLFGEMVLPLEDQISEATRRHIPAVVDEISPLESQLRLLNLAGIERAREARAQLIELLLGDASEASVRLGASQTSLFDDIQWARATRRVLSHDGEQIVRDANAVLYGFNELRQLFPQRLTVLPLDEPLARVQDILVSERFHERAANLRTTLNAIQRIFAQAYGALRQEFVEARERVWQAIEGAPSWMLLTEDDRRDIAGQLPDEPPVGNADLSAYKRLLHAIVCLPALQNQLLQQIACRVPAVDPQSLVVVTLRALLNGRIVENEAQLRALLQEIDRQVRINLAEGKKVQISVD